MGPTRTCFHLGNNYVAVLLDKFTRKLWVLMLRSKDEFFDAYKLWLPRAEACGSRPDRLRTDGKGEFISAALQSFCQERGIKIGYAAPYMHEENGIAERYLRTLVQMKDLLLIDSGLPNQFWAEAMDTANYLRNWLPSRRTADKAVIIPEEAWTEIRQNPKHVRIFGSKVSTHILSEKRSKSDVHKTCNGIFIGYTDTTKHLRAWAPKTHQVLIASEPVVSKAKRGADPLTENPMSLPR